MKHIKLFTLALLATFGMSVMATPTVPIPTPAEALALPEVTGTFKDKVTPSYVVKGDTTIFHAYLLRESRKDITWFATDGGGSSSGKAWDAQGCF